MAKLIDFLPRVLQAVPGCSEPLAIQHIRDICIDFCVFTQIWQETLDPIDTTALITEYDLSPPAGALIHAVNNSWFKGRPLTVANTDSNHIRPEIFNNQFPGANVQPGDPLLLIVNYADKTFTLDPAPQYTESKTLTLRATLKPTRASQSVPDILLQEYEFAISQGAISRLARIPGQSFTDMNVAAIASGFYGDARHSATIRANKTFARSQARVAMRPFA